MSDSPQSDHTTAVSSAQPIDWLGSIDIGTWSWDPDEGTVHWDDAAHRVYGLPPGSFAGDFEGYIALIHPDDRDEVVHVIGAVAVRGGDYSVRHRIVTPEGVVRWVEGQGRIDTVDGAPVAGRGIVYTLSDRLTLDRERDELTASEELARADSDASREGLRFLIDLTDAISGSLNTERVAAQFVSVITQSLATACVVDLRLQDPYGHLLTCVGRKASSRLVVSGTSAELPLSAARITMPLDPVRPLPGEILDMDSSEQQVLVQAATRYVAAFPLIAHGTRIGTVTAVREDRAWSKDAKDLLEAACRRVAGAIDRAELHADRSRFVAMFQAAATPRDLPEIPGMEIAVHYRPATELVRLGGDLYDVFQVDEDTWMVAVGDICGKGVVAAGHAELARTALRSAAFATDTPTEALGVLNRTLLAEATRPMLTVALARLVVCADGRIEVELATAGHPSPLLISGLDEWEPVESAGTMLGVARQASFADTTAVLEIGQSLALYTDGITDSRFGASFFGVERLGKTLAKAWPAGANSLVSDVAAALDTWSASQPSDDVLLLVARAVGH